MLWKQNEDLATKKGGLPDSKHWDESPKASKVKVTFSKIKEAYNKTLKDSEVAANLYNDIDGVRKACTHRGGSR